MFNVENIVNPSAALYIRLSSEDKEKQNESESVTNQRSILLRYAKTNNIRVYDIYIDDGFTGTNFDRPSFKRMIDDIESKKVNIVITKDMSRLGRDYIVTGELMEKYFPSKGVRYIAINDGIDTFIDNGINEITPFKAVINDYYARDIDRIAESTDYSISQGLSSNSWLLCTSSTSNGANWVSNSGKIYSGIYGDINVSNLMGIRPVICIEI